SVEPFAFRYIPRTISLQVSNKADKSKLPREDSAGKNGSYADCFNTSVGEMLLQKVPQDRPLHVL
ncbi:unnamed protein product, partial [Cyprideis torosa]